jgi:sarcosine oxidase
MARSEFEYVVVGLGGLGSSAAYRLAGRAGARVLGLEQFELGHDRGASQDHSRIIRRSYHTPFYVALAGHAHRAWHEVEEEAGERFVVRTGGLDLWPAGAAIPMEDYTSSMRAGGVPFQELDAGGVMRSWPQWRLSGDVRAVFQGDAGVVAAARATAAHQRLAREHGATLRDHARVARLEDRNGEIVVRLEDGTAVACRKAIVAADAWTNALVEPLGTTLPLTVTQEQVTYFAAARPWSFSPERFPVWIWMDDPSFYGVPMFGESGIKVGQDCGGRQVTADTRTFEPDPDYVRRVTMFVAGHLPTAMGTPILTKTCLYTLTPDRDFVIDAVPGHPNILVALGAAHSFKFAALIGRALADLAELGRTDMDLEPFRIDRPALTMEGAAAHWLV